MYAIIAVLLIGLYFAMKFQQMLKKAINKEVKALLTTFKEDNM